MQSSTQRRKILIIDDDLAHLDSTRGILESEGYDVVTHHNPFGATNAVRDHRPDLVLLDVNMPGLSGEQLIRVFGSNVSTRNARVVFYSSNDEDSLRASVEKHGVHGYICKGDLSSLRRRVARYLG